MTCCARLDMIHANEHLNEEKGEIMVVHEYEVLMHEMVKSMLERSTYCFVQRVAYHCKVQSNPDCRLLRQMEIFFRKQRMQQTTSAVYGIYQEMNHFSFIFSAILKKSHGTIHKVSMMS